MSDPSDLAAPATLWTATSEEVDAMAVALGEARAALGHGTCRSGRPSSRAGAS